MDSGVLEGNVTKNDLSGATATAEAANSTASSQLERKSFMAVDEGGGEKVQPTTTKKEEDAAWQQRAPMAQDDLYLEGSYCRTRQNTVVEGGCRLERNDLSQLGPQGDVTDQMTQMTQMMSSGSSEPFHPPTHFLRKYPRLRLPRLVSHVIQPNDHRAKPFLAS